MLSFDSNRTFSMKELSPFDLFPFTSCGYQSGLFSLQCNGSGFEFPRVLLVFSVEAFIWVLIKSSDKFLKIICSFFFTLFIYHGQTVLKQTGSV